MRSWFQPKSDAGNTRIFRSAAPRVTLAAFGKHPGWEDHIPGIGLETPGLAGIKQSLYVSGIGGQIDAGAWDARKLEPEKRVPGFDHWLLWLREGKLYCGRLWSSRDRVGRKEYPMVLCVESEGIAPGALLGRVWPDLESLRQACMMADSAERVTGACHAAQESLKQFAAGLTADAAAHAGLNDHVRREFLQRPELGPDRLGLLRVLHELDRVAGPDGSPHAAQSFHLRVPRAADTEGGGMLLWLDLLCHALPSAPILLLARVGSPWLDIVLGEPETSDFFCLQASTKALPLATEVPYELDPALGGRLDKLTARFLAQPESQRAASAPSAPKPPPLPPPSSPQPRPASVPPAPVPAQPQPKRGGLLWVFVLLFVLVVIGVPVVWFATRDDGTTAPAKVAMTPERPQAEVSLESLLAEARTLVEQGRHAEAVTRIEEALKLKPADAEATRMLDSTRIRMEAATAKQESESRHQAAMEAGNAALAARNFAEAIRQAEVALTARPDDPAAAGLKAQAEKAQAAAMQFERDFSSATNAAATALRQNDFAEAIRQADAALKLKAGDATTTALKAEAQAGIAAQANAEQGYRAATNAAGMAFREQRYSDAAREVETALGFRPNDAAAMGLQADVQRAMAAAAQSEQAYQAALAAMNKAMEDRQFAEALRQADTVLALRPGDASATQARAEAQRAQAAAEAQARYDKAIAAAGAALDLKDFAAAVKEADAALTLKPGDPAATELKSRAQSLLKETETTARYQQAVDAARAALSAQDYATAASRADEALSVRSGDGTATQLKQQAAAGLDQQRAKNHIAGGQYDQARAIYQARSGDTAFAWIPKAIEDAQARRGEHRLAELDTVLQTMLVQFNVLSARDAYIQSPEAQKASRLSGQIGARGVNHYLQAVDRLEAGFAAGDWLNENDRKRYLDRLRSAIPRWQ